MDFLILDVGKRLISNIQYQKIHLPSPTCIIYNKDSPKPCIINIEPKNANWDKKGSNRL